MSNRSIDVSSEFGDRLKLYLEHYELANSDIVNLVNSNTEDIKEILEGSKGIVLRTAEKISQVFGLRYYMFINPKYKLPKFESLPKATQEAISARKEKGVPDPVTYNKLELGENIDSLIANGKLNKPITTKELWALLPEETRSACKPTDVTGLLTRSPRNKIIKKVGQKGREFLFMLESKNQNNDK